MKEKLKSWLGLGDKRRLDLGGYSVAASVLAIALAVALDLVVNALPASYTKLDNTASQVYTLSQESVNVLEALEEDVEIYWIVQAGQEDTNLTNLLERYSSGSDHITVTKRDPDQYPGFAMNYTSGTVYNNSLVVESQQRYRYISYSELYEYNYDDYYTTGSYETYFAGESSITSALDYVTREEMPKLYTLSGHGESSLATSFQSAVEQGNIQVETLELVTQEQVPEDADLILINTPQRDISSQERELLEDYLASGGALLLITDPPMDEDFTQLYTLMEGYGVTAQEGIVVEGSSDNYAWGAPYYLLPELGSHTITSPLTSQGYRVLLPIAQGLTVSQELPEGVEVTEILTTSDQAFSKLAGYSMDNYDLEEGDLEGPFALGVAITKDIDEDTQTQIVWISSGAIVDEQSDLQVSGGNQDLFINAISWMTQREEGIAIHAKSLTSQYLTVPSSAARRLTLVMLGVLPLGCLGAGLYITIRRRRR